MRRACTSKGTPVHIDENMTGRSGFGPAQHNERFGPQDVGGGARDDVEGQRRVYGHREYLVVHPRAGCPTAGTAANVVRRKMRKELGATKRKIKRIREPVASSLPPRLVQSEALDVGEVRHQMRLCGVVGRGSA